MRIGIIGSGALATLFAGRLSTTAEVILLGSWAAQLQALRLRGLTIVEQDGQRTHSTIQVTEQTHYVEPVDHVLVLVKSYQTTRAGEQAHSWLRPGGLAITLQNGLGNVEELGRICGPERVLAGTTAQGAMMVEPGVVRHTGWGETTLGRGGELIAHTLNQAGIATQISDQTESLLWGKLVINAAINPLTAILHQPNGYLVEQPLARELMGQAAGEVAAIAQRLNIPLPYGNPAEKVAAVAQATTLNHSSMWQDVQRGTPTELEAITGRVLAYAEQTAVNVPANKLLYRFMQEYDGFRLRRRKTYPVRLETLYELYQESLQVVKSDNI